MTIDAIRKIKGPVLIFGAGTNAYFGPSDHRSRYFDFDVNGAITVKPNDYSLHEKHIELLNVIKSRNGSIFARGSFTTSVLKNHGFRKVINAGCPSLLVNRNTKLGSQIQGNLERVKQRAKERKPLRVAFNLAPFFRPKMVALSSFAQCRFRQQTDSPRRARYGCLENGGENSQHHSELLTD